MAVRDLGHSVRARRTRRRRGRGSFLSLLVNARHADGAHLSELEAAAQAFTFLLAGARRGRVVKMGLG